MRKLDLVEVAGGWSCHKSKRQVGSCDSSAYEKPDLVKLKLRRWSCKRDTFKLSS
jgi:hypothetical protein